MGETTEKPPFQEFDSGNPFRRFVEFVKFTSRHMLDDTNRRFLEEVVKTSEKRRTKIKAGTELWRAQLGSDLGVVPLDGGKDSFPIPLPFKPDRMKPRVDRAQEGRVNPKGIPCLYLSHDKETAMKEVRPWIGASISTAPFTLNRDLILVYCWDRGFAPDPKVENQSDIEGFVWWAINSMFSEPVERSDETADYAPTQIIAEAFRMSGAEGIAFGRKNHANIALFDLTAADCGTVVLYQVTDMTLDIVRRGSGDRKASPKKKGTPARL